MLRPLLIGAAKREFVDLFKMPTDGVGPQIHKCITWPEHSEFGVLYLMPTNGLRLQIQEFVSQQEYVVLY